MLEEEANHLAIYKCGRGFELGATMEKIQIVVRAGFESGTAGMRVRHADYLATMLPLRITRVFILNREMPQYISPKIFKSSV